MVRPLQRAAERPDQRVLLESSSAFAAELEDIATLTDPQERLSQAAETAAAFLAVLPPPVRDILRFPDGPGATGQQNEQETGPGTEPEQSALRRFVELENGLSAQGNAPDPDELDAALAPFTPLSPTHTHQLPPPLTALWELLTDVLTASLLDRGSPAGELLPSRACRLLMVTALVRDRARRSTPFDSPGTVFQLLRHRTPVLPPSLFPRLLAARRIELVRQARVSDLFVVRSEWCCFEAGEVAEIVNVLGGETLKAERIRIDEREISATTEEERTTTDERSLDITDHGEVSEETQRQVDFSVKAHGQVETTSEWGATKIEASAGAEAEYAVHDTERRATKISRDAVARALAKVENRNRDERVERTLSRVEDRDEHGLANTGNTPARGIYRWVDRINRYQIVRYPHRLQMEFEFPEPGNALFRLLSASSGRLRDPGDFTVQLADITRASWKKFVGERQVIGVSPPPPEHRLISAAVQATSPDRDQDQAAWNVPPVIGNAELSVPKGYVAGPLEFALRVEAQLGKFMREKSDGVDSHQGFRSLGLSVAAAGKQQVHWHAGVAPGQPEPTGHNGNTLQSEGTERQAAGFSWAGTVELPADLRDKVTVAVSAAGGQSVSGTVSLMCTLANDMFDQWQLDVYDALLSDHQQARRDYLEERARHDLQGTGTLAEHSPTRNRVLIQGELRRLTLAWLTHSTPFPGRPAVLSTPTEPTPADEHSDLNAALLTAPEIQFLEQALEWGNMVYVCYPYYWARPATWDARRQLDTRDPELGQFLSAGSARVIVPVRPGFEQAMHFWLAFQLPWEGGAPPAPGENSTYLAIADEIRSQLLTPADGIPGESWEARLPTAFRWLDDSARLPHNTRSRLGLPPSAPADPLCSPDSHTPS
ncbi:hypothetical protein [Streptomyces sp. NBC_01643]|uniref:hypothetical protein n=1 Tax=Streptomyces sp. NBC_01643 TaxID=2975906 RepID=UPI00386DCD2C|nr:hypothetical protein OHB03_47150 [Streptomyces sp. NBC_01643]